MNAKHAISALLAGAALAAAHPVIAHEAAAGEETVVPLLQQAMPDVPGRKAIMLMVNYAPGQASTPHVHPGSVFAYVLEGEVVSQMAGQKPVTYKSGEFWYEPPKAPHVVSKNASATKPARLLVWLLVGEGETAKMPLQK
jgi:quercetin dioxygenase-like cupin family protein